MDIRDWTMSEVMQLPDWCFGERWWVGEYCGHVNGRAYNIVGTEQLPDKFVVWGVLIACRSVNCLEAMRLTIRLADNQARFAANILAHERLLKGISIPSIYFEFYPNQNGVTWVNCERQLVESMGKRLAMSANGDQTIAYEMTVGVQISEVPRQVPDWLVGKGYGNYKEELASAGPD